MKHYNVIILTASGKHDSIMTTGPRCESEFSLPVAQRHAKEFTAKWNKFAVAVPVGGSVALLLSECIEVPAPRNGRPGYRWTQGYYVVDRQGGKIYPPVPRKEAYALARELYGDDCCVVIDTDIQKALRK